MSFWQTALVDRYILPGQRPRPSLLENLKYEILFQIYRMHDKFEHASALLPFPKPWLSFPKLWLRLRYLKRNVDQDLVIWSDSNQVRACPGLWWCAMRKDIYMYMHICINIYICVCMYVLRSSVAHGMDIFIHISMHEYIFRNIYIHIYVNGKALFKRLVNCLWLI